MTGYNLLYFLYGASIMFHLLMVGLFWNNRRVMLNVYVAILMLVTAAQYIKDLSLLNEVYFQSGYEPLPSLSLDLLTVPLYAIVLVEACRPMWVTKRRALLFYAPFLTLMVASMVYPEPIVFDVIHVFSLVYGIALLVWSLHEVPVFERTLKAEFSFEGDINFHWLRGVILLFFVILLLWIYDSMHPSSDYDAAYLISSLVAWIVACFFFYRQARVLAVVRSYVVEQDASDIVPAAPDIVPTDAPNVVPVATPNVVATIVDEPTAVVTSAVDMGVDAPRSVEPQPSDASEEPTPSAAFVPSDEQDLQQEAAFAERMHILFERDCVYLNPRLRLTELANILGTNRTYLSQFINQCCDSSFYDFVNDYRIHHAKLLLHSTDDNLDVIAMKSGFNSLSTFRRAFMQREGKSPTEYRVSYGKNQVSNG